MDKHFRNLVNFRSDIAPWLDKVFEHGICIGTLPQWMPFCGIYLPFAKAIYVKPDDCEAVEFGTIVHELRHAYQRYSWGILRYLFRKAITRRQIEADAEKCELDAVEWYGAGGAK